MRFNRINTKEKFKESLFQYLEITFINYEIINSKDNNLLYRLKFIGYNQLINMWYNRKKDYFYRANQKQIIIHLNYYNIPYTIIDNKVIVNGSLVRGNKEA